MPSHSDVIHDSVTEQKRDSPDSITINPDLQHLTAYHIISYHTIAERQEKKPIT
jgi:hypothetical protein